MNELPEWVRVWRWYRETHPEDQRPFPQQAHYAGEELLDYRTVRELWVGRGSGEAFLEFFGREAA